MSEPTGEPASHVEHYRVYAVRRIPVEPTPGRDGDIVATQLDLHPIGAIRALVPIIEYTWRVDDRLDVDLHAVGTAGYRMVVRVNDGPWFELPWVEFTWRFGLGPLSPFGASQFSPL